ncbi:MAG: DUF5615 family PIN-like protein [Acidimicrobiaceae bacterium]|nr:DUF5615 family PIN-like protein [Acidimicrobiaceae bacterium]
MRWLIDEMLPRIAAAELAALGHEALSVIEAGLGGSTDSDIYETAVEQQRIIVTENFADFAKIANDRLAAGSPCAVVVFVSKRRHPRGSALPHALALHLHEWSVANPNPYPGVHRP